VRCSHPSWGASPGRCRCSGVAPGGFFRKRQVAGWREELSRGEIRAIEHVAGDLMRELGYALVNRPPVPAPVRLR